MPSYFVAPADRRSFRSFFTDEAGAAAVLGRAQARHPEAQYTKQPVEDIWLDAGGSVNMKDVKVYFEAAGIRFGCFAIQIPYLKASIAEAPEAVQYPGCVGLSGFPEPYVFSLVTRAALARSLGELAVRYEGDIARDEARRSDILGSHPHVQDGRCPCGSGMPAFQCCRPTA